MCSTSLVSPKQSVLRIADDHIEQESALFYSACLTVESSACMLSLWKRSGTICCGDRLGPATAFGTHSSRKRGIYIFSQPSRLYRCSRVVSNLDMASIQRDAAFTWCFGRLQADGSGGPVGVTPHPGVSMTNPEGAVWLPSFQCSCQLLIQTKQVALTVRAGSNEPWHCTLCMTLHITCCLQKRKEQQKQSYACWCHLKGSQV